MRTALLTVVALGTALVVAMALRPPVPPSGDPPARPAAVAPAERPAALFVGDSFTAGTGASTAAGAWSCLAASALDWVCNRDAQGGTGFVADGRANTATFAPLPDRLTRTAERNLADVVVVDAGRNDMAYPAAEVVPVMAEYVAAVRSQWPDAALVLVVPAYLGQTADPADTWRPEVTATMRELAVRHDALVVDPVAEQWFTGQDVGGLLDADGVHPDDDGHALLADRFVAAVEAAGLADPALSDPRR